MLKDHGDSTPKFTMTYLSNEDVGIALDFNVPKELENSHIHYIRVIFRGSIGYISKDMFVILQKVEENG